MTELTYVTKMNPCGSIPDWVKNSAMANQGKKALWIGEAFAKRFPN